MTKFKNKYRIESNRLSGWDYSGNGIYFITIVIQNRKCLLGKIEKNEMIFSDFGKIAKNEWYKSFEIRRELFLNEFVIMPNHLHAIVIIDKTHDTNNINGSNDNDINDTNNINDINVDTHGRAYLHLDHSNHSDRSKQPKQTTKQFRLYRKPKSLSSFIAGYKSSVTTQINNWIDDMHVRANQQNTHQYTYQKYNRKNKLW